MRARKDLIAILTAWLAAVVRVQDPKTGVWWQVLDQPGREGNYLEASVSTMLAYALLKGARTGAIDARYGQAGLRAYQGVLEQFVTTGPDGRVDVHQHVCQVAGLGGDPEKERYRDGTYAYYVGEKMRDNDPKAVGPFILASIEKERSAVSLVGHPGAAAVLVRQRRGRAHRGRRGALPAGERRLAQERRHGAAPFGRGSARPSRRSATTPTRPSTTARPTRRCACWRRWPRPRDAVRLQEPFARGLDFPLSAQYPSGGWPQFFRCATTTRGT